MRSLALDLRRALRSLTRSPGYAATAVLTLGLGIGATTAVFSVVDAVLLSPLPFAEPGSLVALWISDEEMGESRLPMAAQDLQALDERCDSFQGLAGAYRDNFNLTGRGQAERLRGAWLTPGYLQLLGAAPILGRSLVDADARPGEGAVVVIAHGLWQRRFGGDSGVVGQTISLNGAPHTVVGVAPVGLDFPGQAELWVPLEETPPDPGRREGSLSVVGRLAAGTTLEAARAEAAGVMAALAQENPDTNTGVGVVIQPLHEALVERVRPALLVLVTAVSLLLLVAVVNVANLGLARAQDRSREVAVRRALGARTRQLVGQFLTESTVLGLVGGGLGAILALAATRAIATVAAPHLPAGTELAVDGRGLAFSVLASLAAGALAGLAPALRGARARVGVALARRGRAVTAGRGGLGSALVATETAMALCLLVGALLLVRSLTQLTAVDPGFDGSHVLTVELDLEGTPHEETDAQAAFLDQAVARVRALPGVEEAGTVYPFPLFGRRVTITLGVEGRPLPADDRRSSVETRFVSPGYLEALRISLLAGRRFTPRDNAAAMRVAVVNTAFASRHFADGEVLGRRVSFDPELPPEDPGWMTVVGVVGDVRHVHLGEPGGPELYVPVAQVPFPWATLVVRTSSDPARLAAPVRAALAELDANLPLFNLQTAEAITDRALGRNRLLGWLTGLFAALAVGLAAVGIGGVVAHTTGRRRRELGLRLAVGASPAGLVAMVVRQGMTPVLTGAIVGVVAAAALVRLLDSLLYGVRSLDPPCFGAATLVLLVVAAGASLMPAWRASTLDPAEVLRCE